MATHRNTDVAIGALACAPAVRTLIRIALAAAWLCGAAASAGAQPPAPVSPTQGVTLADVAKAGAASLISPETIRQRIRDSGLSPVEVRARLTQAGYPATVLDPYLGDVPGGARQAPPASEALAALAALGLGIVPEDRRPDAIPAPITPVPQGSGPGALRPFGFEVFERATSQFQPLLSGPVDPDYRLGPGDQLVLILTGEVEAAHSLEVTREGFVVVPQVGQLWVNNLTLAQLTDLLYERLGRVYSGVRRGAGAKTHFQISLSRLRVNQVFVVGEVTRPGAYQIPSVGTAFYALYLAGGPNDRGSYRAILIRRAGKAIATLDIYDYLLRGDNLSDVRLEAGDVVFVPVRNLEVGIWGNVVRPAFYELGEGDGLRELVRLAGGVTPKAFLRRVQIDRILPAGERNEPGVDRVLLDADISAVLNDSAANIPLEPSDVVGVFAVSEERRNYVTLRGNVLRPGVYQYVEGMKLWDLLREGQGFGTDTYLERAHIFRNDPDASYRVLPASLWRDREKHAVDDPPLRERDEVVVYSTREFRSPKSVSITGAVKRPGDYPWLDGMTLLDLTLLAGGLSENAYLAEAEVARGRGNPPEGALADTFRVPLDSTFVVDRDTIPGRHGPPAARAPRFELKPFDNVLILSQPNWDLPRTVAIRGRVYFPGTYVLRRRDERLAELVARAGGLMKDADPGGVKFTRAANGVGRIGLSLERALRKRTSRDNLVLMPGDEVYVPQSEPVVRVEGAVNNPISVAFAPGRSLSNYLEAAGGLTRKADRKHIYVTQPNGEVRGPRTPIKPGARIMVPERPDSGEKSDWPGVLTTMTSLVTSAVTLIVVARR